MKSSNKFLAIAVILLLAVNIALVIFLVTGKSRTEPAKRSTPFEMMMKDLGMTEDQKKSFDQYREEHFKKMKPLLDSVRAAKAVYFGFTKDSLTSDSTLAVYGQRVADLQAAVNRLTFSHFQRVRSLFEGEQQRKYDDFLQKMVLRKDTSGRKKDAPAKN